MWPGRVEDQVRPQAALEEHPGRVDGDALGLLVLERVEQEGVLERLRVELALGPDLLELALGERVGVGQEPADDRALAVVDVADDHDVHPLGARRGGHARFGRGDGRRHAGEAFLRESSRQAPRDLSAQAAPGSRRRPRQRAATARAVTPVSARAVRTARRCGSAGGERLTAPPRRSRTDSSSRLPWRPGRPDRSARCR